MNHVEVNFDWDYSESYYNIGKCRAFVYIKWDTRIQRLWKYLMYLRTREILRPEYNFVREIQEKYENTDVKLKVVDAEGNDESRIEITIKGSYVREQLPNTAEFVIYEQVDFGSDRGKKIKREFKQYVCDAMTSLMKRLLAPPDTPMQPVMTLNNSGRKIFYDDNEDFHENCYVDWRDDYKLETTDVFFEKYWIDLLNGEYIVKEDLDYFITSFVLLNNKRIPLSRGVSGIVVSQYKLKF